MSLANKKPAFVPTVFVVFGATGDLMARKLAPALASLYEHQLCPDKFKIIGVARRPLSDAEFTEHIKNSLIEHDSWSEAASAHFPEVLTYHQGNFTDKEMYESLRKRIRAIDDAWGVCSNSLFYLAVPPENYEGIFKQIKSAGLMEHCGGSNESGWSRLLIEKPFGRNLAQAEALETQIEELFTEDQIYRIDHYLAKETLQNVLPFRFSNTLLEQTWDRGGIEKIDIVINETIDASDRGAFYDEVGALLDVGQNHALQMLGLVTMDQPATMSADNIRDSRADVLEAIRPIDDIETSTFRAQYDGYRDTKGVDKNSNIETFFRLQFYLDHPQWAGVPITISGGKKLADTAKSIVLTFKHPHPCLCAIGSHYQNEVHIRIQPDPGIAIKFWAHKPGSTEDLEPQWLEFAYPESDSTRYKSEYSQLLLAAINGDQTLFVSKRENLAAWQFIDPILTAWHQSEVKPVDYQQIKAFNAKPIQQTKNIGVVGLGKMGFNLATRLSRSGWNVVGYNRHKPESADFGLAESLRELVDKLPKPRTVWLMLPHQAIDTVLFGDEGLASMLDEGDMIIDGGNTMYKDTLARVSRLEEHKLKFMDVGVSGGPGGALHGSSLMIGGNKADFERLEQLFIDLAVPRGYGHFGSHGAGHFVKMVHNGIEYGMMQAIAEGFDILRHSDYDLDLAKIAAVYNHGSVITSSLVGWLEQALIVYGSDLENISGSVDHSGEGAWTVDAAKDLSLKATVISQALQFRIDSEKNPSYSGQILSALRHQFGGHEANKSDK